MPARRPAVVTALAALLATVLLAGCSSSSSGDDLQVVPAAVPAVADPQPTTPPAGTVRAVGAVLTAAQQVPGTSLLALLTDTPYRVLLTDTTDPDAPPRAVDLPGRATTLAPGADGHVLVAADGAVLDVDAAAGTLTSTAVDGDVVSVARREDGSLVAGLAGGTVVVLGADGVPGARVTGLAGAEGLVATPGGVYALDRQQTAVFTLDLSGQGATGLALRAGTGAGNAVADRFGRVVVTDTAGGTLVLFGTGPLLERQQYPVPGAPWALAYDATRNLAWVTLTATDEVVGYELTGGEPVERYRFPTVHRPDSVAVDPGSGAVFVASAAGDGVQTVDPQGSAG